MLNVMELEIFAIFLGFGMLERHGDCSESGISSARSHMAQMPSVMNFALEMGEDLPRVSNFCE